MKINLVMIVKNEERSLRKCLEQAALLVDDMIIVDTGSQDGTRAIAEEMGAIILDYQWTDDFSAARNFALDQSDGDWNLVLDADEYLYPCTREALEQEINEKTKKYGRKWLGAITRYDSYREGEEISTSASGIPRLLPGDVRYSGPIHEQPDSEYPCYRIRLEADHDGYLYADKGERNLPYLESAVRSYPQDMYYRYQLAATLRNLGRLKESLGWFREFYGKAPKEAGYRCEGVLLYLYTLMDLEDKELLKEAGEIIEREQAALGNRADFCFLCGLFYMKLVLSDVNQNIRFLPMIESSYLKCLAIGERPEQGGVVGAGSYKAAYNLGLWYEVSGQMEEARKYYKASANAGFPPAILRLKNLS